MGDKIKGMFIAAAVLVAMAIGGAAIAGAAGGNDPARDHGPRVEAGERDDDRGRDDDRTEKPITGNALDKARAAALDHTNGGRATETEVGDEEGAYEVEVTRADGSQVDVHLDRGFNVLSEIGDDE